MADRIRCNSRKGSGMRKIILLLTLVALWANAGWITSAQSAMDPKIETTPNQLSTYGINPRLYVFTVTAKDGAVAPMQCIIVYTEQDLAESKGKSTAPVMQCIPF